RPLSLTTLGKQHTSLRKIRNPRNRSSEIANHQLQMLFFSKLLGSQVFSLSQDLLKWIAESSRNSRVEGESISLHVANVASEGTASVRISPENLLGRHCAILGTTGGGKSWTVSRILEEVSNFRAKAILLDATGEFRSFKKNTVHLHIGAGGADTRDSNEVTLPYTNLTENDLFAIFRPSGQTQAPKLRAAIKSLKLLKIEKSLDSGDGVITKAGTNKSLYETKYKKHSKTIDLPSADFEIGSLSRQINEECVWPIGGTQRDPDPALWGNYNESERSYCVSLMNRIEDILTSPELACIFKWGKLPSLIDELEKFLKNDTSSVLRICLRDLPFSHSAREIVANAIGRYLLAQGRKSRFAELPLVIFLDEAHQFLDKSLGDENNRFPLDAFELIAKEGRKYSLCICLSTQRPRDIPEAVLSQMGTFVVHRLINARDREIVEKASGDIDRPVTVFLPTLAPGEAVIIGAEFLMPLTVQILQPTFVPESFGPAFQKYWAK
ncbi:MAG: ATP-binding protein, partial [Candidatus Zixiibacteriota bacterium]